MRVSLLGWNPFLACALGLALSLGFLSGCNRTSSQNSMPRLRLTELMAQNDSYPVTDSAGKKVVEDWVEVHNPNSFPVNLASYSLSDKRDKPKKFQFPPGMMIPPDGYVVVFLVDEAKCQTKCEQKRIECEQAARSSAPDLEKCKETFGECLVNCSPTGLVAQFNISSKGEAVFLFGQNGTEIMDQLGAQNQPSNVSNGIDPVTGELGVLYIPTPGAQNQRINLRPARFLGPPTATPAPNPATVVLVTATVERDASAPGALQVSLEFADLPSCASSLDGQALSVVPALQVDNDSIGTDTSRVDLSGKKVDVDVVRRTYQAALPPAGECDVRRVFRMIASDPSARVESRPACVTYCFVPVTVQVSEYQPKNNKIVFSHQNQQGEIKSLTPDWIEIHNYGDQPVDIRELGLASAKAIGNGHFDTWLFGRDAKATDLLAPNGFFFVLADNDDGQTRKVYHLVSDPTGHLTKSDPSHQREYFSTHFKLDPTPKPGELPGSFSLVTKAGNEIDQVVLDFSGVASPLDDKSVGRFESEGDRPNVLKPGTITDCPTPGDPNVLVCEVAPAFEKVVTRGPGGPRCPAPAEPITLHARVNFDSDALESDRQVEFHYRLEEAGTDVNVPVGPDLTLSPAAEQAAAAPGSILYDVTANIPGQPDKTLVIFRFGAIDSKRGRDELKEGDTTDPEASLSSFRYLVGYEAPPDHPLISEVLPGNENVFVPPDQGATTPKHPDFAEIYNPKDAPADLAGYHLTTEPSPDLPIEKARHWTFPADPPGRAMVPAKGFLTVYFDSFPATSPFIGVDKFNLSACGETLYLIAPDKKELGANCVVASFTWNLQNGGSCKKDQAVGRICNDSDRVVELALPTPNGPNVRPPLLHDTFHQPVIPPGDRNECVEATSTVQLSAVIFLDRDLKAAFPESRGIASASFLVDRGSGEEEFRVTQFSAFPLCSDSRPTDCASPPAGYENVSFRALIPPPLPPVVRYRARVVDACSNVLEAGPFSFGTTAGRHPQVAINEINRSFAVAAGSPPQPWIELLNYSSAELDLSGMYLTDDVASPRKTRLPDGARAPAGGALLLLTRGAEPAGLIHVGLDWERVKGTLLLFDSTERGSCILDKFDFDFASLPADSSLGRDPDGSGAIHPLDQPSPGRPNGLVSQTFVRGDVTNDLKVNVVDMVRLLAILFSGDTRRPPCEDALDANDDGKVNATDAVFIGASLIDRNTIIPQPFPQPGTDPTPDELSSCK